MYSSVRMKIRHWSFTGWLKGESGRLFALAALLIVLLALALRIGGLTRDFPYAFHCDVPKQIEVVFLQFKYNDFTGMITGYPVGHQQITYAVMAGVRAAVRLSGADWSPSIQTYYVFARLVCIAFGLAGLAGAILAGRRLFGPGAALIAGLLLAVDQFYIVHSHHAMGDIPQASLSLVALWLCTRVLQGAKTRDFIFTGLAIGASIATKYYGGFMLLTLLLAFWWAPKRNWAGLFWSLVFVLAGFLILTPSAMLAPQKWFAMVHNEFQVQSANSLLSGRYGFNDLLKGWNISFWQWHRAAWFAPWLLPPAIFVLAYRPPKRENLLLLSALLPTLLIINLIRVTYLKDSDQIVQIGFIYLGLMGAAGIVWSRLRSKWIKAGMALAVALIILAQVWSGLELAYTLRLPDTRQLAQKWLAQRLPRPPRPMIAGLDIRTPIIEHKGRGVNFAPVDMGYDYVLFPGRRAQSGLDYLKSRRGKELAFLYLHSFRSLELEQILSRKSPPLKEISFIPRSWQNPSAYIRDPNRLSLDAPFRPQNLRPMGWPELDFAHTPYSRREVREAVLFKQTKRFTIMSRQALGEASLLYRGHGLLRVNGQELTADSKKWRVHDLKLRSGWTWFTHSYHLDVAAQEGQVLIRLALTKSERAAAHALAGQQTRAVVLWKAAQAQNEPLLPQDQVTLARALAGTGQPEAAKQILDSLNPEFRSLLGGPDTGGHQHIKDAIGQALQVPPYVVSWERLEHHPGNSASGTGGIVYDPASGKPKLRLSPKPDAWCGFESQDALAQEYILARFKVRALAGSAGQDLGKAVLSCFSNRRPVGDLAQAAVIHPGHDQPFWVEVRARAAQLPARLGFKLVSSGQAPLELLQTEILPDLQAWAQFHLAEVRTAQP